MNSPTLSIFDDLLPIDVPSPAMSNASGSDGSMDSLFDERPTPPKNSRIPRHSRSHESVPNYPANRHLRDGLVPGLIYDPLTLVSPDLENQVLKECLRTWFVRPCRNDRPTPQPDVLSNILEGEWELNDVNQVMLFNRTDGISSSSYNTSWPECLSTLLIHISHLLKPPVLDPDIWNLLFSSTNPTAGESAGTRSRQAIVNLYHPGEGISDHVDLLDRYGDGIIGVSFGTGCVMRFKRVAEDGGDDGGYQSNYGAEESDERQFTQLYLPPRSIITMTGDARYRWSHGIPGRVSDLIDSYPEEGPSVRVDRGMRLSVTFRWLLAGADVVGSK